MRLLVSSYLALTLLTVPALAEQPQDQYYRFLSRETIGAEAFTKAHREWDGRGVVIAVLDTGVDPGVPGLRKTSTGDVKVIETRDFSGQGTVKLAKARALVEDGVKVLRTDAGFVRGYDKLSKKPADGVYWLGFFKESSLKNSSVPDINLDGSKDDVFAVVAFEPEGGGEALCAIDLDGNGDLAGEKLRPSYRVDRQPFAFPNADPRKNQQPVTVTVAVLLDDRQVELHFDDGGHGTHCAGIAAGHGIQGRQGFDGIAPGAHVMSLKIGDNSNAGGATTPGSKKAAIEYASKWARDHQVPVVISLSYSIGSEREGWSDIDKAMSDALEANPLLVASVAAGNEGPGISTIGTPGASARVFTTGAVLPKANAEALWGGRIAGDRMFWFSSRGGELDKPDAVAPGVAWSTVPPFLRRAVMAGTSMAAPQTSGVHALLISGAIAKKLPWNSFLLKRALRATARPLKGYTRLDQGAGLIQVGAAFNALAKLARRAHADLLVGWDVATAVPHRPGDEAPASYWRTGRYVPEYPEQIAFTVRPVFFDTATDKAKTEFFTTLDFFSDSGWLRLDRGSTGVRGTASVTVKATVDAKKLSKPGLHLARIRVRDSGSSIEAFALPVALVMPWQFTTADTRKRRFTGKLEPGSLARVYVEVPPGATSMRLALSAPRGRWGNNFLEIHDPHGRSAGWGTSDSAAGKVFERVFSGSKLQPGIWEVIPYSHYRNHQTSHWELEVTFHSVEAPASASYSQPEGEGPSATIKLTNRFDSAFVGKAKASVLGMGREQQLKIKGHKKTLDFSVSPSHSGVDFYLQISPTDHGKFTDIAVSVRDGSGKSVAKDAFNHRRMELHFRGKPGDYQLEIAGATTHRDRPPTWEVELYRVHRLKEPIVLSAEGPEGSLLGLYPNVRTSLTLTAAKPFAEVPEGFHHAARLELIERAGGATWLKLPLRLER